MSRKVGYIIVTIITVAIIHPTATFQAKSAQLGARNPVQPADSAVINPHQEPDSKQVQKNSQDRIVINTKLVNLTVSVNDKLGRFVTGLTKEDFEIFDDTVKQDIAFFSDDDAPISMGIVYDVSASMQNFSSHSLAMLRQFFDNSHMEDEFYVYAFNNRVQLVQDFTSLPEALLSRVTFIKAKGNTALYDATYAAVEKVRQGRHHKKVILIFSDGEENSSRYSGHELQNLLKENDVQIYAIGMSELSNGAGTLRFITEPTGGQTFFPFDYFSAEVIYTRLALMLRRQYVIGFYPSNATSGTTWHKLHVQVKAPSQLGKLKLSYKNGYWMVK
jgi:Ca-activated chloride channel family protein